jgi:predicted neuraminidase
LGKTWEATPPVNDGKEFGAIQPCLLFHSKDRLQAIGRTKQAKIFQIWSDDSGKTWGKMTATVLPNPNSGIDALTLKDGRQLVVYNHTTHGRSPLNVAVSSDGESWQAALVLEHAPGEYSYPAVMQAADGQVHISYTWNRVSIKHVTINPAMLELRPMHGAEWPTN